MLYHIFFVLFSNFRVWESDSQIVPILSKPLIWFLCRLVNLTGEHSFCIVPSNGPSITSLISRKSTEITVEWNKLSSDVANGVITMYGVCYKVARDSNVDICSKSKDTTNNETTSLTLPDLKAYTEYEVAVRAKTKIGWGKTGTSMKWRTKEDSKLFFYHILKQVALIHAMHLEPSWGCPLYTSDASDW